MRRRERPEPDDPSGVPSIAERWHNARYRTPPSPHRRHATEVAVIGILVVWNLIAHLALPDEAALPLGIAAAALLVVVARRGGVEWNLLGLQAGNGKQGALVGLAAMTIIAAIVLLATLIPATREYLADERLVGVGWGEMLYETLLRIPLGTALAEEIAFRGVVLGLLLSWMSPWRALLASSTLFGLWHILPAIEALENNPAADLASGAFATVLEVSGQVMITAVAGAGLTWLRFRGNGLTAPFLAHWGVNGTAYLAGWLVIENAWT